MLQNKKLYNLTYNSVKRLCDLLKKLVYKNKNEEKIKKLH